MPKTEYLAVKELSIDLKNPRTRETKSETDAVHALIALKPHYFWDLMRSLIEDGYHGTENILVLDADDGKKIVREGNRRIGAMKIAHGLLKRTDFDLPKDIEEALNQLAPDWKKENESVPCRIYNASEANDVTKLVRLTHARGESAGRLPWDSVARSRFNRDVTRTNEPTLNLLESYLATARNLTEAEREQWGGDYPITVLHEALQKVAARYELEGVQQVVEQAENDSKLQKLLGPIIHDIGTKKLQTRQVRLASWGPAYGLPAAPSANPNPGANGQANQGSGNANSGQGPADPGASGKAGEGGPTPPPPARGKRKAVSLDDPRSVRRKLNAFAPTRTGSSKVVTLLLEARQLKLDRHRISFCFLLRSMLEISARAYCSGKRLSTFNKKKNREMTLAEILTLVANDIAARSNEKTVKDHMNTARSEVASGKLSVFMLNQLVHMPNVIPTQDQIIAGFHQIFPLLEAMNE